MPIHCNLYCCRFNIAVNSSPLPCSHLDLSIGVPALAWGYPWATVPSLQRSTCCVVDLATATVASRCTCSGTAFWLATVPPGDPSDTYWSGLIYGLRYFGVYVVPRGFIHKSQSLWLKFTLESQPVQLSSTGGAAPQSCLLIPPLPCPAGCQEEDW